MALSSAVFAVGCKKTTSPADAGADLTKGAVDLAGVDLSEVDLSVPDMGPPLPDMGSDMDDHVALRFPPRLQPNKTDGGVDYYEIHVQEAQQQVLPGPKTTIWGFAGQWPGPSVYATLGRPVTLRIYNDLPTTEHISIHNHGHNVAAAYDGHPSANTIAPGSFYDYKYPNMQGGGVAPNIQGAGTYFFHDHAANLTAQHVYKGMAAFYIIQPMPGSTEAALNLPSGNYDIPLLIQDRTFNADNSLNDAANVITGFTGDVITVNGTPKPYFEVARRKYRFRLLNGAPARRLSVGLSSGSFFQIASDAGMLPSAIIPARIALGPAERADIVIDFANYQIGDVVTLTNMESFSPPRTEILQFRVVRNETDTSSMPTTLDTTFVRFKETPATDMGAGESVPPTTRSRTLTFTFDSGSQTWRINGKVYNSSAYEFGDSSDMTENTKLGDTEVWSLVNTDVSVPHPFHQHMVPFQILDICPNNNLSCGTPPVASQAGWKDTVMVPAGSTVRIKMKFIFTGPETPGAVFPGNGYVFHCHTLEHEDHLMMLQHKIHP